MALTLTHAEAFEEAIREEPDELAHRLVFADWLDEQDDPELAARAEFIRVQCELARLEAADGRRPGLLARERQLREAHGREWAGPLRALVAGYEFRRGFVESVGLDAAAFLRWAPRLFQLAPLTEVEVTASPGLLPLLAANPYLRRVTSLGLDLAGGEPAVFEALFDSPFLTGLTHLRLRSLHGIGLRPLARSWALGRLARLDLSGNNLGPEVLAVLAGSDRLLGLTALYFNRCHLGSGALPVLTTAPLLRQLTALDLRCNDLGPAGAETLARSPHARRLQVLWLGDNVLRDGGVAALASAGNLAALTRLYLGHNAVHGEGVEGLARSPFLAGLTHLDLDYNDLAAGALESLAASPFLRRLQVLYLRCGRGLTPRARQRLLARFGEQVCRF
jgi:uncharacterized protein (TIGR02996 family)